MDSGVADLGHEMARHATPRVLAELDALYGKGGKHMLQRLGLGVSTLLKLL